MVSIGTRWRTRRTPINPATPIAMACLAIYGQNTARAAPERKNELSLKKSRLFSGPKSNSPTSGVALQAMPRRRVARTMAVPLRRPPRMTITDNMA
jgi:hypothetical protein